MLFVIAAMGSINALVTAEAPERVPIHLAGLQVRLVWLALRASSVLRIQHELVRFTFDARFRRRASSPAER
jgi:hypothetical protein